MLLIIKINYKIKEDKLRKLDEDLSILCEVDDYSEIVSANAKMQLLIANTN